MLVKPKSVLIVGGGTAGWVAANLLMHAWPDTKVSLIESADVGIIGVGEGGTPYLKQFFKKLNIDESEWMAACDATYKVGISFEGWSGVKGYDSYFHPFFSVLDKPPAELFFHNCGLKRRGYEADANPDNYFITAELARAGMNPVSNHASVDIDYAYHFDSAKLGKFLAKKAKFKGLTHIIDHVVDVKYDQNNAITCVTGAKSGDLQADFFIDCSGFKGLLINELQKSNYKSYQDNLLNNAAVAIQTPYQPYQQLKPQTRSVALTNGWMWNIPLQSRQGNGYVYSDNHMSPDQAELELRQQLNISDNEDVNARHLKMRIGRLENHWHQNCLAVGLSQGFIEPLEATALMITQLTIEQFIESYEIKNVKCNTAIDQFNKRINTVFDGVREYIVAHYQLSKRQDTDYWKDNQFNQHSPKVYTEILKAWESGGDVESTLNQYKSELVYLRPSWYCILAGMGRFPSKLKATKFASNPEEAKNYCRATAKKHF
jgi:hypothetical protein